MQVKKNERQESQCIHFSIENVMFILHDYISMNEVYSSIKKLQGIASLTPGSCTALHLHQIKESNSL